MNGFVAFISARSAVFQMLIFSGRSRQLFIHFEYNEYARVSDVGRSASLSPTSVSPECVTQNTSGLKPLKCSFSFPSNDSGIKTGRNPFLIPIFLNYLSSESLIDSQIE
jgi:hypothetical protein